MSVKGKFMYGYLCYGILYIMLYIVSTKTFDLNGLFIIRWDIVDIEGKACQGRF